MIGVNYQYINNSSQLLNHQLRNFDLPALILTISNKKSSVVVLNYQDFSTSGVCLKISEPISSFERAKLARKIINDFSLWRLILSIPLLNTLQIQFGSLKIKKCCPIQ